VITLQDKKGLYPSDPGKGPQAVTVVVAKWATADWSVKPMFAPQSYLDPSIDVSGLYFFWRRVFD